MRKKVTDVLIELGVTPNLKGFDYICRAVEIISNSKKRMDIVKGIYADIANEFDTTSSRTERAIRHAFSKVDKESEAYKKYIGIDKTTNSTLLYTLAYRLREDNEDEIGN